MQKSLSKKLSSFINNKPQEMLGITVKKQGELPDISLVPVESVGKNEVRVMMVSMGYCGRDKSTIIGQKTATPGRIGHEGAGIVIEKGENVKNIDIGQNIIIFPFINGHNIGYDWPDGGKGIFAEYPVVPEEAIFPVGRNNLTIDEWKALALIEPFACNVRGLTRANIKTIDLLVILGAGPIGCEQVILSKYFNPDIKIILVDILDEKIKQAKNKQIPADVFLSTSDDSRIISLINEMKKEEDKLLVIHSNPNKNSLKQGIKIAGEFDATILLYSGIYDWCEDDNNEIGKNIKLSPKSIHYEEYDHKNPQKIICENKEVTLIGSRGFDRKSFEIAKVLIETKKINPLLIISNIIKFDENIISNLLEEGSKNQNIKILMTPFEDLTQ